MKYYLGIDGGGTRTVAAVSDEIGNILVKKEGKSINFYSVGMDTARKNLKDIIENIKSCLGVEKFYSAFIGCSALDGEASETLTQKLCGDIIYAEKIKMHSDVYIALKAVGKALCPCAAVCGTGSMAVGEDKNGCFQIVGGWGHTVGDEGSAYAIALRALKLCCRLSDKGEEDAPLLKRAISFFGVENFRDAIDMIYAPKTTKDVLAQFAAVVGELASAGDGDSLEIISTEAELFADTVLLLLDRVECCDTLGLYGGVFQNNDAFIVSFSKKIKERYPCLEIRLIDTPPEESALELARKL